MANYTSATLREIAGIAGVPDKSQERFVRQLKNSIEEAKEYAQSPGRAVSAVALDREFFSPVKRAATALLIALERLEGHHPQGRASADFLGAALFLKDELRRQSRHHGTCEDLPDLIASLNLDFLIKITDQASKRARAWLSKPGRKKGTKYPAFDMFVMMLLEISKQGGGKLTIYRTSHADERWAGSLLEVIELLRPMLPQTNFFPANKLGYSLHNVYQRRRAGSRERAKKSWEIVSENN